MGNATHSVLLNSPTKLGVKVSGCIEACHVPWILDAGYLKLFHFLDVVIFVVREAMCGYRWRSEYDSALASSAVLFHNTDANLLKPDGLRNGRNSQDDPEVFDPMSTRRDFSLTADTATMLHNLWQTGDKGDMSADFSDHARGNNLHANMGCIVLFVYQSLVRS